MTPLAPPFPWYGGKRRWADDVWRRFGVADVYVEPFAGSLAVLLANQNPARREIVCDKSGFICNFWRAVLTDPEATAYWADYPTVHQDLTARHKWLRQWGAENGARLSDDCDYFDAKAAGWWVWGISLWIGSGWCSTGTATADGGVIDGRPYVGNKEGARGVAAQRKVEDKRPWISDKTGYDGRGVAAQRPVIDHKLGGRGVSAQRMDKMPGLAGSRVATGKGVSAQRVPEQRTHGKDKRPLVAGRVGTGVGISAQREPSSRPHINSRSGGQGIAQQTAASVGIHEWFEALAARLKRVIVLNRDWTSAVTSTVLSDTPSGPRDRINRCIMLDPPYRTDRRKATLYDSDFTKESDDAAVAAYEWAVENGERYRIAYFCHVGDFPVPAGWHELSRDFSGHTKQNTRDCAMFSPACVEPQPDLFSNLED